MADFIYKSATWMAEAIRNGELSSVDLVSACIERIQEINPMLNAVVQVGADQAIAGAKRADEELERGNLRGPLHGIPMTIKDSIDTAGMITTWGTMGRKEFVERPNPGFGYADKDQDCRLGEAELLAVRNLVAPTAQAASPRRGVVGDNGGQPTSAVPGGGGRY